MQLTDRQRTKWIEKCYPKETRLEILEAQQKILLEKIFWEDIAKYKSKNPDMDVSFDNLVDKLPIYFSSNLIDEIYSETDTAEDRVNKVKAFIEMALYHFNMINGFMQTNDLYMPRQDLVLDSHGELKYWLRCAKCGTIICGSDSYEDYSGRHPIVCPHCVPELKVKYRTCRYTFPDDKDFADMQDWAIWEWRHENDKWFKRWSWLKVRPEYIKHWLFKTFQPKAYQYKIDHLFDYLKIDKAV
jgi:hypothetical protein